MTRVVGLTRHPIKGIGREPLETVDLTAGAPMPGDRAWALLHQGAEDTDAWQPRRNFLVVAYGPRLAQIATTSEPGGRLTVRHPDLTDLTFDPATEGTTRLIDWIAPLWPEQHSPAHRLVKAPPQGMADNGEAQVALLNLSSLRALSQKLGQDLDVNRFRGNIILDDLPPWGEFDLLGKSITIGGADFTVTERIERCRATEANPSTGQRDANTLGALEDGWGHRDFGVYATVTAGGTIALGDAVVGE